jgi:hypothetical protein
MAKFFCWIYKKRRVKRGKWRTKVGKKLPYSPIKNEKTSPRRKKSGQCRQIKDLATSRKNLKVTWIAWIVHKNHTFKKRTRENLLSELVL